MSLLLTFTVGYANEPIKVFLDGNRLSFDQPPIIENGRTLVPMRMIFESMGAEVTWNDSTQTVTAQTLTVTKEFVTVTLKIGSTTMIKNGEEIILDVPAQIVNERTLVPVRAVAESFGANVEWNDKESTVIITSQKIEPKEIEEEVIEVPSEDDTSIEPKELSSNASLSNSMINVGGSVKIVYSLTANGEGGSGNYKYRFEVLNNGKIISKVDYSTNNSISDTITGTGDFSIKVYVKDDTGQIVESIHSLTD